MAGILYRPHKGAEHQVETAGFGKVAATFRAVFLFQLVRPKAEVALATFHQGVGKVFHMAAGNPHLGGHQDGGVQPDHILPLHNNRPPPSFLDLAFQFHAQRPVVPSGAQAAIDFAALKDKAAALGQGHYLVHIGVRENAGHGTTPPGQQGLPAAGRRIMSRQRKGNNRKGGL